MSGAVRLPLIALALSLPLAARADEPVTLRFLNAFAAAPTATLYAAGRPVASAAYGELSAPVTLPPGEVLLTVPLSGPWPRWEATPAAGEAWTLVLDEAGPDARAELLRVADPPPVAVGVERVQVRAVHRAGGEPVGFGTMGDAPLATVAPGSATLPIELPPGPRRLVLTRPDGEPLAATDVLDLAAEERVTLWLLEGGPRPRLVVDRRGRDEPGWRAAERRREPDARLPRVRLVQGAPYAIDADLDGRPLLAALEFGAVTAPLPLSPGWHTLRISGSGAVPDTEPRELRFRAEPADARTWLAVDAGARLFLWPLQPVGRRLEMVHAARGLGVLTVRSEALGAEVSLSFGQRGWVELPTSAREVGFEVVDTAGTPLARLPAARLDPVAHALVLLGPAPRGSIRPLELQLVRLGDDESW